MLPVLSDIPKRMSSSLKQLTQDLHLCVSPIWICTKWTTSVYVKVISEQLKFAHLPRSTLCVTWRWNNKSTKRCQLITLWGQFTQFTFPSHTVCLVFIAILPYYWRFHGVNSDHINNVIKVVTRFVLFPNLNSNFQIIVRSNLIKIRPVGSKFFHVEEHTDMTKLTAAWRKSDVAHKSRPRKLRYSEKKVLEYIS